eukprot:scaffold92731_cov18-Tisochrysis_lutea.AAC.1
MAAARVHDRNASLADFAAPPKERSITSEGRKPPGKVRISAEERSRSTVQALDAVMSRLDPEEASLIA